MEDSDKEIADSCSEDFELEDPEPSDDEYDSEDDNTDDFLEMEPGVFEYNSLPAKETEGRNPLVTDNSYITAYRNMFREMDPPVPEKQGVTSSAILSQYFGEYGGPGKS